MPLALSLENLASQADLDAHLADTSAAHAASAISFSPTGTIAATDVQAAIAEVASEAGGGGVAALADPGATWQAETAYSEGDRIGVADLWDTGDTEVFEATAGGTSDSSEPSWDISGASAPTTDGTVTWEWLGHVGAVGFRDYSLDTKAYTLNTTVAALNEALGTLSGNNAGDAASGDVWTANGDGTAGFLPVGGLQRATVTLSSADILDLHNTPIEVIPAPAAGRFIIVHRYICQKTFETTPYSTDDAGPALKYDGGDTIQTSFFNILFASSSTSTGVVTSGGYATFVESAVIIDSDGSVFSDGDGSVTVTLWYTIEDVPA